MSAHGRLGGGADAPVTGEDIVGIARTDAFVVEQILSGTLDAPRQYMQEHDE